MGSKRKKKRKSTHQWPSVPEHHSVHTSGHKMSQFRNKRAACSAHTRTSQREQHCVCCTQTLPRERSEAREYEPKWLFARHPARVVFFNGKRRRQLGGKKCRLSVTQVWLFWWNGGTRIMCQKRIMSIQTFRRPTKSARCFTILATPSRDLGGVPPFHEMIDQATYCCKMDQSMSDDREHSERELHDFTDSLARDSELWDLGGVPPFHKMIDQATYCWLRPSRGTRRRSKDLE